MSGLLKLAAADAEDLEMLSARLQDAVGKLKTAFDDDVTKEPDGVEEVRLARGVRPDEEDPCPERHVDAREVLPVLQDEPRHPHRVRAVGSH